MSGPAASSSDKEGASGPAASSSQEPELFKKKTKRVLLLPAFPEVPISEEEQALAAARRVEREEVEKRLAERAANLTTLFRHFTTEPTRLKEKLGKRWEQREEQSVGAKKETQSGETVHSLTPDEAWQTSDDPSMWEAYLHRAVQFLILVSELDRQQEVLKQVATMTIGELVVWYRQGLNVLTWNQNRLFVRRFIVGIGCYIEAGMIDIDKISQVWHELRLHLTANVLDESMAFGKRIGYKYLCLLYTSDAADE